MQNPILETSAVPQVDVHPTKPTAAPWRWLYCLLAWLLAAWVVFQVFAIGMVFMAGQGSWLEIHELTGYSFGLPLIALIIVSFIARLSWRVRIATMVIFVLYGLQYTFVGGGPTFLRAFHAVNALAIFFTATTLAQHVGRIR